MAEHRCGFASHRCTDWQPAGVTHAAAHQMMIRGLVEREGGAGS